MVVVRSFKFRVYPSKEQEGLLGLHLRVCQLLWNLMLEFAICFYNDFDRVPTKKCLFDFVKKQVVYSQVGQQLATRLHNALKEFAKGKRGFPRFKSLKHLKSLTYPQSGFKLSGERLNVTPFGSLKIKKHRNINGKIKTLSLKREASGKWHAVLVVEVEQVVKENFNSVVGVDLGLEKFATLSNGVMIENRRFFKKREFKLGLLQRRVSRKVKRSKNWCKAIRRVVLQYEKIARSRKDFLHKASTMMVNNYSTIVLEDLNVGGMSKGLFSKGVHDVGWSLFTSMLAYKAEGAGTKIMFVNANNTTQECSKCNAIVRKSLSQRVHACSNCGLEMDRDLNAALNVLKKGLPAGSGNVTPARDGTSSSVNEAGNDFFASKLGGA